MKFIITVYVIRAFGDEFEKKRLDYINDQMALRRCWDQSSTVWNLYTMYLYS